MSFGLGIQIKDAIIIGCDSRGVYDYGQEIIREDHGKWYDVTDRIVLVGTGSGIDPERQVREIQSRLPDHPEYMSMVKFEEVLEDATDHLHERHNIQRPPMDPNKPEPRFDSTSLVAFTNVDHELGMFYVLHSGILDLSKKWCPVGSLALLGEFLLQRFYRPDIDLRQGLRLCWYVLKEIARSDPYVGGEIRLGYIERGEPYFELSADVKKEIDDLVQERRSILHDSIYHRLFDDEFTVPL